MGSDALILQEGSQSAQGTEAEQGLHRAALTSCLRVRGEVTFSMQGCHQGMAILSSHTMVLSECPRRSLASNSTGGPAAAEPWLCAPRRAGAERRAVQRLLSNYQQENLRLHQAA